MHYWDSKYPDSAILIIYIDDDYSQGCGQIKEAFRVFKKDDILQPYVSDKNFHSSNDDKDCGYNLYVFDIRHQKNLETEQPITVDFKFSEIVLVGIYD